MYEIAVLAKDKYESYAIIGKKFLVSRRTYSVIGTTDVKKRYKSAYGNYGFDYILIEGGVNV